MVMTLPEKVYCHYTKGTDSTPYHLHYQCKLMVNSY